MTSIAKSVALEFVSDVVSKGGGLIDPDAVMNWLCNTSDGRECLAEEIRNHKRREKHSGSTTMKTFSEVLAEADDADDDDDLDDDDVAHDLIDRIIEAHGGKITRIEALRFLTGDILGREVARQHSTSKGDTMNNTEKVLKEFKQKRIAKLEAMDIVDVAKTALAAPNENILQIDEAEYTELVTSAARKEHPNLRPDAAFSKLFGESSERGKLLRAACNVVKAAGPMFDVAIVEGDAQRTAANNTEQSEAYEQLSTLAEKLHAAATGRLSKEQAFARALADPKNKALAAKALQRPAATTSYPFPR